jgi:hypothetical protein
MIALCPPGDLVGVPYSFALDFSCHVCRRQLIESGTFEVDDINIKNGNQRMLVGGVDDSIDVDAISVIKIYA